MGLHESYAAVRGQLLMMDPLPSVSHAYSLIKQEEKQRLGYVNSQAVGASFMVNKQNNFKSFGGSSTSNTGRVTGSTSRNMLVSSPVMPKSNLKCTYCNGENHVREACFKLHGYPPNRKKKGQTGTYGQGFRSLAKAMQVGTEPSYGSASSNGFHPGNSESQGTQIEQMQAQISQMSQMMN